MCYIRMQVGRAVTAGVCVTKVNALAVQTTLQVAWSHVKPESHTTGSVSPSSPVMVPAFAIGGIIAAHGSADSTAGPHVDPVQVTVIATLPL